MIHNKQLGTKEENGKFPLLQGPLLRIFMREVVLGQQNWKGVWTTLHREGLMKIHTHTHTHTHTHVHMNTPSHPPPPHPPTHTHMHLHTHDWHLNSTIVPRGEVGYWPVFEKWEDRGSVSDNHMAIHSRNKAQNGWKYKKHAAFISTRNGLWQEDMNCSNCKWHQLMAYKIIS